MPLVPVDTSASGAPDAVEDAPAAAGGVVELDESGLTPDTNGTGFSARALEDTLARLP
ncbi:hypothetical protein [Cellulomonas dongxiuzhuiae]|uniref:Uncharacterized protein n=1 Tax=Cellulomonas dongxiuzhuiae TaxID=2819979 RepID=A0ABX8GIQ1_9CELL|nr:hypothetical protein [Cellulomonas dongxiuzhuiae]MBO3095076.1 hypothetical protein [Cellulomonas dongxiuzhuiae]QWC16088.1 hypothetical protein KKR89_17930 [Cellulomonas dongxiuzhuiae]